MKQLLLILIFTLSINAFTQENKSVTLVVSGQGETQDEAKQNALRSAIEQAFGTFISSNTKILNDELVKDEIVSVSNGNIEKFAVISEVKIPEGGYATTLKATVSVTKLTSFCESKGVVAEFKGSLFGANIRQQKLNEESELKAIITLCEVSTSILSKSLDFSLEIGEPTVNNLKENSDHSKYVILLKANSRSNSNYDVFKEYFQNSINSIAMSEEEKDNYQSLGKQTYHLDILDGVKNKKLLKAVNNRNWEVLKANKIEVKAVRTINKRGQQVKTIVSNQRTQFYFRNPKTTIALQNFMLKSNRFTHSFKITSNQDTLFFNKKNYCNEDYRDYCEEGSWMITDLKRNSPRVAVSSFPSFSWDAYGIKESASEVDLFKVYDIYFRSIDHRKLFDEKNYFTNTDADYLSEFRDRWGSLNMPAPFHVRLPLSGFLTGDNFRIDGEQPIMNSAIGTLDLQKTINNTMTYDAVYSLEQMSKLSEFKIEQLK